MAKQMVLIRISEKIMYSKYGDVTNHQTLYWTGDFGI